MKHAHRLAGWILFGFVAAATRCNRGSSPISEDTNAEISVLGHSPIVEVTVPARQRGGHHEFHCSSYDRVFVPEGCDLRLWKLVPRGFTPLAHELVLYDLCAGRVGVGQT